MTNELRRYPAIIATGVALFILAVMLVTARAETRAVEGHRSTITRTLAGLAEAQRNHHDTTGRYSMDLAELGITNDDAGLSIKMELYGKDGWSAVASHRGLTVAPDRCGIFLGAQSASPHRAVVRRSVVYCW